MNALRLGRRLATEVQGSGPGRRAFIGITPFHTEADRRAAVEGWTPSDRERTFRMTHHDYDETTLGGWDYDVGEILVRTVTVTGEAALTAAVLEWGLTPAQFRYASDTADPR